MKELFKKPSTFTKIEFWAITTIFAFVLFFFIADRFEGDDRNFQNLEYKHLFDKANVQFDFYIHYFYPRLINHIVQFLFVLYLNFVLIPKLIKRQALLLNIVILVVLFAFIGIVFGITGTYLKGYLFTGREDSNEVYYFTFLRGFEQAWLLLWLLIIYTALKYAGIYLLALSEKIAAKYRFVRKEAIVATIVWMLSLFFMRILQADLELVIGWAIVAPSAIAFYLYSFYRLIPRALRYNSYQFLFYFLKSAFVLLISFFAVFFLFTVIFGNSESGAEYSAFNSFFQLFITAPVSWALYKRFLKGNEEINVLQKELERSSASVDFLRSQINPHFLFNALNTLYGTAIQENAERTSEGIQKLGDMMRFMLQENMQDKISLTREVDYLNNYIDLQKLRTDTTPGIQISTEIQDRENFYQIAPMLLIPFVENAFKHGISFREPSHIKINLEVKDGTLYFDVYNSKHVRNENDPEKDKSGIGLENVRQRLKLFYPNKHELIIRDTTKEFFVHLTIQLAKSA